MRSLLVLAACIVVPWMTCGPLKLLLLRKMPRDAAARDRVLGGFRRVTLALSLVALVSATAVGALATDPDLFPGWPTVAAWFFSSLCATTFWVAMALSQRTPEEVEAMSSWEAFGRAVQTSALWVIATGVSVALAAGVGPTLPLPPAVNTMVCAVLCVIGVVVLSPWLLMVLGIWRVFGARIEVDGISWRLAHLPAATPFLTHVAALPWLRTVLVSDGLLKRVPERHWKTLVHFEVGDATASRLDRAQRWVVSIPLSVLVFVAADVVGSDDPKKLVAGLSLAVAFTLGATWIANRQPASALSVDHAGPSLQDLAQTLRHLPPSYGQAMPRTSHKALGSALYDRLFALGHDPGPRPRK
ncbi:MAG: hypothetical protein OEQ49_03230 [Myxococcales bacterium]|nr:hypothetical protein [Myxococcales bacterium]